MKIVYFTFVDQNIWICENDIVYLYLSSDQAVGILLLSNKVIK